MDGAMGHPTPSMERGGHEASFEEEEEEEEDQVGVSVMWGMPLRGVMTHHQRGRSLKWWQPRRCQISI